MNAFLDIFSSLPSTIKDSLSSLFSSIHFTQSQKLEAVKEEADLVQWKEESFCLSYKREKENKDGREGDRYIKALRKYMSTLRESETDYSGFFPEVRKNPKIKALTEDQKLVLSRCPCPVDGEKTRCCKIRTLDAVMQCAFGCSYCSIQAFYNENEIKIVSNLEEKLNNLEITEDVWHIGTGQASDSLLLGDDYGTLSALSSFAEKHPDIVIELKSKSKRDVFTHPWPKNMVFTWSLNAPTIIEKEEHFTASLIERLEDAEKARDNGNLVGFHIHPMFYFKGWEDEYKYVVYEITSRFSPSDILLIGIGTLTFTKAVIKRLREMGAESKVLEMELVDAAGKYSYPLDKKEKMFKHIYSSFPKEYEDNIFFYLCMEDPSLWMKCLGREYSCDKEFEMDMKRFYLSKINSIR
ncbi:MAG: spore photoproduct lyase family protein [Candidatus Ornithospirochaeta sp.]